VPFSYGILEKHYGIFPFKFLKDAKTIFSEYLPTDDEIDSYQFIFENDVKSLIRISSDEDVLAKRTKLIEFIWKDEGFPTSHMPSSIQNDIADDRYHDTNNLKKIDKFTISMDYGVNSTAYLFHPDQSNNHLIIYHRGHTGDFAKGKDTIQFFLNNGFSVLAFSMPLLGMNNQPVVDLPQFGKIKLLGHKYFQFLETSEFSPIKFFVEPIAASLNYIEENHYFDNYYMIGISGGGWTTVLYAALDQRILHAYSVAGSVPIYLRSIPDNFGDYEQKQADLYNIANYLELYVLGSYGDDRKFIQIFNKYDPCCFSGELSQTYSNEVKLVVSELNQGGHFEVHIDDTHKGHIISEHALQIVIDSLKS